LGGGTPYFFFKNEKEVWEKDPANKKRREKEEKKALTFEKDFNNILTIRNVGLSG